MANEETSRHIYQASECLVKTSESVAALLQELTKALSESSPPFSFVDSYGYSSSLLGYPRYWFRTYQGCLFVPREEELQPDQGSLKNLKAGDLVLTVVAQFYWPRTITQAELWFGVCRLNKDVKEWSSLIYMVTPGFMNYWKSRTLPEYGHWTSNTIKRSDNPDMTLDWSRQPLGAFTDRAAVRSLLAEPLREKFAELERKK